MLLQPQSKVASRQHCSTLINIANIVHLVLWCLHYFLSAVTCHFFVKKKSYLQANCRLALLLRIAPTVFNAIHWYIPTSWWRSRLLIMRLPPDRRRRRSRPRFMRVPFNNHLWGQRHHQSLAKHTIQFFSTNQGGLTGAEHTTYYCSRWEKIKEKKKYILYICSGAVQEFKHAMLVKLTKI